MNNSFVSDVVIVSSKDKCPPGYKIVNVTTGGHDADLYEGSIAKRGERYLCFAQVPGSNTVITELNIVRDKDAIPVGFTAVKNCKNDSSEKALRKHVLCVKTCNIQNTRTCVINIVAVKHSKGENAPGNCYTISNDVNGVHICFQVMPVAYQCQPQMPYPHGANMAYRPPNVQSSYQAHNAPYPAPTGATNQLRSQQQHQIAKQQSINKMISAIQGVQFQVNPKFEMMWKHSKLPEKSTRICSLDDIEKKYGYTFKVEQNLLTSR